MSVTTTLAACNTNPALNGPDGASDLPSTLDDAIRYALSFIALIRDGGGIPTGAVFTMASAAVPTGFLACNGALVSRTTYAALFAYATAAGLVSEATWAASQFGSFSVGDGSTTFRLPDLREMFIRGASQGRANMDSGRVIGTFQDHTFPSHAHGVSDPTHTHSVYDPTHTHGGVTDSQGNHAHNAPYPTFTGITAASGSFGNLTSGGTGSAATDAQGIHSHNLSINGAATGVQIYAAATGISIAANGSADGHPRNIALPMCIKY